MSSPVIFDDRDPIFSYDSASNWSQGGVFPEYQNTTSWTNVPGATVTISFKGTAISVFGTNQASGSALGVLPANSTYRLDTLPLSVYFNINQLPSPEYNQLFYQKQDLPLGSHTLVITNAGANNLSAIFLDYIKILTSQPSSALPSPSLALPSPSSALPLPSSALPSPSLALPSPSLALPSPSSVLPSPSSALPPPSSPPSSVTHGASSTNNPLLGPILGAVLGGFALLLGAVIVIGLKFLAARKSMQKNPPALQSNINQTPWVQPVAYDSHPPSYIDTDSQLHLPAPESELPSVHLSDHLPGSKVAGVQRLLDRRS